MGKIRISLFASMLLLGSAPIGWAQTGTTAPPGAPVEEVVFTERAVAKARVAAIDYAKRTVVLEDHGQKITLKVNPRARNFDQVKVGDQVEAEIYKSAAVSVRKAGEPPSAGDVNLVEVAPRGEKPAGIVVNTMEITAKVDNIDVRNGEITLTGPEGQKVTYKLGDKVQNLEGIMPGDEVTVRFTEAVAMAVEK
jgi:hypothetical protein